MNKIHRLIFAIATLLTTLGAHAANYKIETINISGSGEVTAKMGETTITTNSTLIPENTEVTLTVTPNSPGFYLKSLSYEEVTDLGQAQAPQHRADPTFQNIHTIPLSNANDHFGGNYTFRMPKNNVIITAVFDGLDSFSHPEKNITFSISGDATYDGTVRSLIVNDGSTQLTEGLDFQITAMTLNGSSTGTDHTIQKAGNYVVTVQGIGKYQDSKESGTLTINHKALTITAKNQTYQYSVGGAISPGTNWVTTDGLVAGDNLTGIALTQSTSNATGSTPGTITPSAATTTYGITNYSVTYNTGTLVINPKPISTSATFTQEYTEVNYNTTQQKPNIAISDGATLLAEGTDYDITYTSHFFPTITPIDFSQPDIYYITITYKGNYSGEKSSEYQIRKQVLLSNDYRWITYYTPTYNMEVPTGFKAYAVSGLNTNAVELSEKNYIKAGKPMLLYRTGDGTSFFPPLVSEVEDWTASAKYKSNPADWNLDSDNNIQNGTTKIWILVRDYFVRTKSGTLAEGKCYLDLSGTTYFNAPLYINQTPTGINAPNSILNNLETGAWYTLDGCKLHGIPSKKGIYINNGKKIIIK